MFNFFGEVKEGLRNAKDMDLTVYNLINISGKILYVEGHCGLLTLSKDLIIFKIKNGRVVVEGEGMFLQELTENTLKITGKIKKVESF